MLIAKQKKQPKTDASRFCFFGPGGGPGGPGGGGLGPGQGTGVGGPGNNGGGGDRDRPPRRPSPPSRPSPPVITRPKKYIRPVTQAFQLQRRRKNPYGDPEAEVPFAGGGSLTAESATPNPPNAGYGVVLSPPVNENAVGGGSQMSDDEEVKRRKGSKEEDGLFRPSFSSLGVRFSGGGGL